MVIARYHLMLGGLAAMLMLLLIRAIPMAGSTEPRGTHHKLVWWSIQASGFVDVETWKATVCFVQFEPAAQSQRTPLFLRSSQQIPHRPALCAPAECSRDIDNTMVSRGCGGSLEGGSLYHERVVLHPLEIS